MKRKPAGFSSQAGRLRASSSSSLASTTGLVHGELEMMRKMAYIYIKAGA